MSWLILNDEVDYVSTWYPTYIVDKDKKLVPVFIGASQTVIRGLIGLYIKDSDYDRIRHDKAYILIHNPEATDDDVDEIDWDKIPNCTDQKTTGREHIHVWKDAEFKDGK